MSIPIDTPDVKTIKTWGPNAGLPKGVATVHVPEVPSVPTYPEPVKVPFPEPPKRTDRTHKLVEIFESVKGEGTQAGIPMVFVRFSHCNLDCAWCDTPYNRVAIELTEEQLINAVLNYDPAWVIFTGGEPMLQLHTGITEKFRQRGIGMAIETNGMIWNDCLRQIDYINISPKLGQKVHPMLTESGFGNVKEVRYTFGDDQKDIWNVTTGEPPPPIEDEARPVMSHYKLIGINCDWITISPLMDDPEPLPADWKSGQGFAHRTGKVNQASLKRCLYLVQKYRHCNARLSTQVHKFIGER